MLGYNNEYLFFRTWWLRREFEDYIMNELEHVFKLLETWCHRSRQQS